MLPNVEIRLFGPIRLWVDGVEVRFGGAHWIKYVLALLTYRYQGQPVERAELRRLLWPASRSDRLYDCMTDLRDRFREQGVEGDLAWRLATKNDKYFIWFYLTERDWIDARALRECVLNRGQDHPPRFTVQDFRSGDFLAELDREQVHTDLADWVRRERAELRELFDRFLSGAGRAGEPDAPDAEKGPTAAPSRLGRSLANLPPRNRIFTGREELFDTIDEWLRPGSAVNLWGSPGVGKTAAAVEYAYRQSSDAVAAVWIDASSPAATLSSLSALALRDGSEGAAGRGDRSEQGLLWLRRHPGCLVVADAVNDLGHLEGLLSATDECRLLLTSRRPTSPEVALPVRVRELDADTGATLLLRRAGMIRPGNSLEVVAPRERAAARPELCGQQAPARQLAGAARPSVSRGPGHHGPACGDRRDHPCGCGGADVPGELRQRLDSGGTTPPLCQPGSGTHSCRAGYGRSRALAVPGEGAVGNLDEVISEACRDALLWGEPGAGWFEMHAEFARAIRRTESPEERTAWEDSVLELLNGLFQTGAGKRRLASDDAVELANALAEYLLDQGRWEEAKRPLNQLLRMAEQLGLSESLPVMVLRNDLIVACHGTGDYAEVERISRESLAICRNIEPSANRVAGGILMNLADHYWLRGRLDQAEIAAGEALQLLEAAGTEGRELVPSELRVLFLVRRDQGRITEAEELPDRERTLREESGAFDPVQRAHWLHHRALLSLDHEDPEAALTYLRQALRIARSALGKSHPRIGKTLEVMAVACLELDRPRRAERLARGTLAVSMRAHGPRHELTASVLFILGQALRRLASTDEARACLEQAMALESELLPENEVRRAQTALELARAYTESVRPELARPLLQGILVGLGEDHRLGKEAAMALSALPPTADRPNQSR